MSNSQQQQAINNLVNILGVSAAVARNVLERNNWNPDTSVAAYFDNPQSFTNAGTPSNAGAPPSVQGPDP